MHSMLILAASLICLSAEDLPKTEKEVNKLDDFMRKGGMVVCEGVDSVESIAPYFRLWDTNALPASVMALSDPTKAALRNPDGWGHDSLLLYPNDVRRELAPNVAHFFDNCGKSWRTAAIVNGNSLGARPAVLMRTVGKGQFVLSTIKVKGSKAMMENLETARQYGEMGFRMLGISYGKDGSGAQKGPFNGSGSIGVKVAAVVATNVYLAVNLEVEYVDNGVARTRTFEGDWRLGGPGGQFDLSISKFFDIYGKYKAKLIVKDVLAGNSITLKTYEGELPGYMEVSGPTYRGMVSTARRQKDVRVSVKFNTLNETLAGREVEFLAYKPGDKTTAEPFASTKATLTGGGEFYTFLPMPENAPEGEYALVAKSTDRVGREVTATGKFKIVPVREGQVFIDQDGVLLADGKPWYPFGVYHVIDTNDFQRVKDLGFDLIQSWSAHITPDVLDTMKRLGIRCCCESAAWGQVINHWRGAPPPVYNFETNADFRAGAELALSRKGTLAFWYTADEPGIDVIPGVLRIKDYWEKFDPEDHPSYVVSTGDPRCAVMGDIMGLDIYVRYWKHGHSSFERIGSAIDNAHRTNRPGQCVIMVPQSFGNAELHCEVPEEIPAMAYTAVVHGAKGLFWYCWWDGNRQGILYWPESAEKVSQVIQEVRPLSPALLSGNLVQTRSEDGRLHACCCGTKESGEYVIAVNTADEVSDTKLVLPALKARKLTPLYGSPKASVDGDGAIAVKLGICDRAVWKVE